MRMSHRAATLVAVAASAGTLCLPAVAAPYTPPPGSAERKAILDTIRPKAEAEFGKPIVFVVDKLRVKDGYAYALVKPQRPEGVPIRMLMAGGRGDAYATAVLKKQSGRWIVLQYVSAPSDAAYCEVPGVPVEVTGC